MEDILQGLNEAQTKALLLTQGAVLVTAGAGSGKTKLLTHRIAYLIKDLKVSQDRILAVTFTNKAAKEMGERVSKLISQENRVWISTFHSMCLKILRENIGQLGQNFSSNFTIYDESDSEKTLKQVLKDCNIGVEEYKKYSNIIGNCCNENVDILTYQKMRGYDDETAQLVFDRYEKALESNNALDFDHLLTKTYELFVCVPQVLQKYAERFEYIFVDEFQDTNKVQYDIVKLLSSVHKNIFVVGDEDQCIYTWRGANFRNIFNFKTDFAPVKMFKLEQNYRSTKNILEKANMVIKNNDERFDKVLWTDNQTGEKVESFEYYDEQEEAESVISKIIRLKEKGYKSSDIAILMRINALSLPFEKKFLAYNIPYKIYGGFKFYERQEIKNVICYLRMFENPNDDTSTVRIINFPKRAIGDAAIDKIREYSQNMGMSILAGLEHLYDNSLENFALYEKTKYFIQTYKELKEDYQKLPLDAFCKQVIDKFDIKSAYQEKTEENTERKMNIDVFVNSVKDYVRDNGNCTLGEFLESITLESDLDFDDTDASDNVILTTIHSVKGLEFKVVFVVGLEEGIFPLSRSLSSPTEQEEERRLMYVAMTRAREKLTLTHVKTRYLHGRRSAMLPSRFIEEAGLSLPTKPKHLYFDDYDDMPYNSHNTYNNSHNSYNSNYNSYNKRNTKTNFEKVASYTKNTNGYTTNKNIIDSETKKTNTNKKDYKVGQKVSHPKFGKGEIVAIVDDGECVDIMFEKLGKKTLILELAPLTILGE